MKFLFYTGLIGLALFEVLNVYFIMPMPGSQQMNSIDLAYFLYTSRWIYRLLFLAMILLGSFAAFRGTRKWIPVVSIIPVAIIVYFFNFSMTADHMFLQPETLAFKTKNDNTLSDSSLVVSVTQGMESKAYPVRYIQYHHQVRDTIAGRPIMVTYCNVCRTGRVYEPIVDGKPETFRLVGMDHFNAMFEDHSTKSWWRQATGEAITGEMKGKALPEVESAQLTLKTFFTLHPFGKVMQAQFVSKENYDTLGRFEKGKSKGQLTRTDSLSWKDKSWVVGIVIDGKSKAYDWRYLKEKRVINDKLGSKHVVLAIASDDQSFAAFERFEDEVFTISNDTLHSSSRSFDLAGRGEPGMQAEVIRSYQEFWHSWKQFHPDTEVYK